MIDGCDRTFEELATSILPGRMEELRHALKAPHPLSEFAKPGVGPKTLLKRLGYREDFSGCYVLLAEAPFYVGISRKVVARLRNHVKAKNHQDSSLVHAMAVKESGFTGRCEDADLDPAYMAAFREARSRLAECCVAFVEIQNPLELYLFEAYAAMALDTGEWNTFETH